MQFPFRLMFRTAILILLSVVLVGCARQNAMPNHGTKSSYQLLSLGLYELSSFDAIVHDDSVHVVVVGLETVSSKASVFRYIHSEDGGRHWSLPVDLGADLPASLAARGNDIQLAVSGKNLLAVWQSKGELPGMGPMASVYSHDGGKTWQAGANPAANDFGDQAHIDLVADQQGNFHAVWLEDPEENGYQSLRYARSVDAGEHWQPGVRLDDSTCSCCWNILGVSTNGQLDVLYRDMVPRDMALVRSTDHGSQWQPVSKVGDFHWQFDGCPHIGGGLTYTDQSEQLQAIVWTGSEPKPGLYHLHSENNGQTWSAPQPMGIRGLHGDIAAIDSKHVLAIWDEMGPEGSSIVSELSSDGGISWANVQTLSKPGSMVTHPRIVATSAGFLALWSEKQPKQKNQLAIAVFD